MNLVLLGGPGAGKGTQAEVLSKKYNLPVVGTGAIFRKAMKDGTAMGLEIRAKMDAGELVPDDITIKVVEERLMDNQYKKGFILDGYPRTIRQAEALDASGIKIDIVIAIEVEDDEILNRLSGRRFCPECNATYHIEYKKPKLDNICDNCGASPLIRRKDDEPNTILSRIVLYKQDTKPLIEFYRKKGILEVVIGQEKIKDTTRLTLEAVEGRIDGYSKK